MNHQEGSFMPMVNKLVKLSSFVLFCEITGLAGGYFTARGIPDWYSNLKKPPFNPPSWVFTPVWTILYVMMGISAYLVYEKKEKKRKTALLLFAAQLFLNFWWTILFFTFRSPLAAFIEIIALLLTIVMTIVAFWPISKKAAILLLPYLLWVCFASVLNYSVWKLNS
jgi:tryptophan-rich sensory protein